MKAIIFNRKGLIQQVIYNIELYTKKNPSNHVISLDDTILYHWNVENVEHISTRQWNRLRNDILRNIKKLNIQNSNHNKLTGNKVHLIDIKRIEL